ncbi:hypothetical protein HPP92_020121 [Vanilla planifolia]|uniref:NPH3 domain-containing protein n=1 Tax=Vanilla planifolia TaxID=51239 RepID=A0A835QA39_VANPL|nr:hypothetical protein HPP92_020121 [Vanilla planifolia]
MQLEYATLDGLLVPNFFGSDNLYDTDSVERMLRHFWSFREANIEFFSPMSSETAVLPLSGRFANVTKLVDTYLAEVAPDVNLKPQKMKSLMEALPESCRTLDDGMYRALDIYFKEHPWLPEREREQLCTIINWSRLSFEACTHASQNERLPLRFILQVLFFEQMQLRAALSNYLRVVHNDNMTSAAEEMTGDIRQGDGWVSVVSENQHLRVDMERLLSKVRKLEEEFVNIKQEMGKVSKTNIFTISRRSISRTLGCTSMEEPQTSWS